MNRKSYLIGIVIVLVILSMTAISNATVVKQIKTKGLSSETINRQIYLGYASMIGYGSSSTLEAVAENDLTIGIDSQSSFVDFYINYNMTCLGETDEGTIGLLITLNGVNNSVNAVIINPFETYKNGTLKIENVEVNRGDALGFWIEVIYTSIIPPYINETKDFGAGVISKTINPIEKTANPLFRFLDEYPLLFPILRQILKI